MLLYNPISRKKIEYDEFKDIFGEVMADVCEGHADRGEQYSKNCWIILKKIWNSELPEPQSLEEAKKMVEGLGKKNVVAKQSKKKQPEQETYIDVRKSINNKRKDCLYGPYKLFMYLLTEKAWNKKGEPAVCGKNGISKRMWDDGYVISKARPKDIIEELGIKRRSTFYTWIKALEEDGYIDTVEDADEGTLYVVGRVDYKGVRYLYEDIM